jgi:hypothetical protein
MSTLNNKNICFINAGQNYREFFFQEKTIKLLLNSGFKVFFLNVHNLRFNKDRFLLRKNNIKFPKRLIIKDFYTFTEFENFFKNKKFCVVLNSLSRGLEDFGIYYYLKKYKTYTVFIDNIGQLGGKIAFDIELKNIFRGYKHIIRKGSYYIWRILTIINLFPKINLLFISDKKRIYYFKNGLSAKFEKLFPFFKISLYRKIVRVNSRAYDNLLVRKPKKGNIILYADSPIDHADRTDREGQVDENNKKIYNENVFYWLSIIGKKTNKKVLITLHPSDKFNKEKKKLIKKYTNISISSRNTDELIHTCEYLIFTHSSAVVNAIILKKKIIFFKSKHLGRHFLNTANKYRKILKLFTINIDDRSTSLTKNLINTSTQNSIKRYDAYIKQSLINSNKRKISSASEIVFEIKKLFKFSS